jgi:hypothetical protein
MKYFCWIALALSLTYASLVSGQTNVNGTVPDAVAVADVSAALSQSCRETGTREIRADADGGDSRRGQLWLASVIETACFDETVQLVDVKTIQAAAVVHDKATQAIHTAALSRKRRDPLPDKLN